MAKKNPAMCGWCFLLVIGLSLVEINSAQGIFSLLFPGRSFQSTSSINFGTTTRNPYRSNLYQNILRPRQPYVGLPTPRPVSKYTPPRESGFRRYQPQNPEHEPQEYSIPIIRPVRKSDASEGSLITFPGMTHLGDKTVAAELMRVHKEVLSKWCLNFDQIAAQSLVSSSMNSQVDEDVQIIVEMNVQVRSNPEEKQPPVFSIPSGPPLPIAPESDDPDVPPIFPGSASFQSFDASGNNRAGNTDEEFADLVPVPAFEEEEDPVLPATPKPTPTGGKVSEMVASSTAPTPTAATKVTGLAPGKPSGLTDDDDDVAPVLIDKVDADDKRPVFSSSTARTTTTATTLKPAKSEEVDLDLGGPPVPAAPFEDEESESEVSPLEYSSGVAVSTSQSVSAPSTAPPFGVPLVQTQGNTDEDFADLAPVPDGVEEEENPLLRATPKPTPTYSTRTARPVNVWCHHFNLNQNILKRN